VKHIYSTGIIYDHHLQSSKYFYNTGHWTMFQSQQPTWKYLPVVGKMRIL